MTTRYQPDTALMADALNAVIRQAILEGTLNGRDGKPVDNEAIHARADEFFRIVNAEYREASG